MKIFCYLLRRNSESIHGNGLMVMSEGGRKTRKQPPPPHCPSPQRRWKLQPQWATGLELSVDLENGSA